MVFQQTFYVDKIAKFIVNSDYQPTYINKIPSEILTIYSQDLPILNPVNNLDLLNLRKEGLIQTNAWCKEQPYTIRASQTQIEPIKRYQYYETETYNL